MTSQQNINQLTDDEIEEAGYHLYFNFGHYFIAVEPMLLGKGRIIISDYNFIHNSWCYATMAGALVAFAQWQPEKQKEPTGWFRNPQTGRRRPDGDPSKEYIRQ